LSITLPKGGPVSFQAYLDNIESKTGMTVEGFHQAAEASGLLATKPTATQFVTWLAADYGLGRGHAMAIYAVFKKRGWVEASKKRKA
jgi:hypothetical protein